MHCGETESCVPQDLELPLGGIDPREASITATGTVDEETTWSVEDGMITPISDGSPQIRSRVSGTVEVI